MKRLALTSLSLALLGTAGAAQAQSSVTLYGVIDAGLAHALQQVLGRGGLFGLVGSLGMVREPWIVFAGEAVEVGVDHGDALGGWTGLGAAARDHERSSRRRRRPASPRLEDAWRRV